MISIITYIISTLIAFFAFSNIALPLFYVFPRFIKFKKQGLATSIPMLGIFIPAIVWILVLFGVNALFNWLVGSTNNSFVSGLFTAALFSVFSYKAQRETIRAEMYDTYKKYFSPKGVEQLFK